MRRKSIATKRFKDMPCRRCGLSVRVGSNSRKMPLCQSCAEAAVRQNAEQLVSRSGPYFERWRDAIIRMKVD